MSECLQAYVGLGSVASRGPKLRECCTTETKINVNIMS